MVAGLAVLLFSASMLVVGSLRGERSDAPALTRKVFEGDVSPTPPPPPMALVEAEKVSKAARESKARFEASRDRVLARLQHIEGRLHLVKAVDAWDVNELARAGMELLTAADNLERGARYVRLELDARALAAAANARAAARRLQSGKLATEEFWQVTDALDAELRTLEARIGRKT
jgi:hypothetical protein